MSFPHLQYQFASLKSRRCYIPLELMSDRHDGILNFTREEASGLDVNTIGRFLEIHNCISHFRQQLLHRLFQYDLIHRHESKSGIIWLQQDSVTLRNGANQPLHIQLSVMPLHSVHTNSSRSNCSNKSRWTIARRCFDTRENASLLIADPKVNRRSSISFTS